MDLDAARETIAAANADGIEGYARPPGDVAVFPCYIVGDPDPITYHSAFGSRHTATLPIRVVVARSAEQDSTKALDDLVSFDGLPAALEALDPAGTYDELVAVELVGGYADFIQDGQPVGLAADITARVVFK